jgi:hypothetical protein
MNMIKKYACVGCGEMQLFGAINHRTNYSVDKYPWMVEHFPSNTKRLKCSMLYCHSCFVKEYGKIFVDNLVGLARRPYVTSDILKCYNCNKPYNCCHAYSNIYGELVYFYGYVNFGAPKIVSVMCLDCFKECGGKLVYEVD